MLMYYDAINGRTRMKRRYVWAACGFLAGCAFGTLILSHVLVLAVR